MVSVIFVIFRNEPPLMAPAPGGTGAAMRGPDPSGDFEEDFVDGFSLGDGAVDDFAINVIIDDDVLRGAGFFVGPGYVERRLTSAGGGKT